MVDWKDALLTSILDCGYADIYLLEDCQYDMEDVIEYLEDSGLKMNINALVYAMFQLGKGEIQQAIDDRIKELESEEELSEEEQDELNLLKELDPYDDIESFHNYLDTHVYFSSNRETYEKYLESALNTFSEKTGFDIS